MGGKEDRAYAQVDHLRSLPGTGEASFKSDGGGRQQELRDSAGWVLREEELILSTPVFLLRPSGRRGEQGTVSERNREPMAHYAAVGESGLETLEVAASGWLHSVEA